MYGWHTPNWLRPNCIWLYLLAHVEGQSSVCLAHPLCMPQAEAALVDAAPTAPQPESPAPAPESQPAAPPPQPLAPTPQVCSALTAHAATEGSDIVASTCCFGCRLSTIIMKSESYRICLCTFRQCQSDAPHFTAMVHS